MKITKLELLKVRPRWMFLKMYTDTDLVGLGEPVLEGHCTSVEAVVREFEDYLIGKDPMQIEHHVQALYRGGFYRGGPLMLSAISGIEQAMWDIKGKYYNCPVWEMLGGKVRDKMQVFSIGGGDIAVAGEQIYTGKDVYPHNSLAEIKQYCQQNNLRLWQYVQRFEDDKIHEFLGTVWKFMYQSIDDGLNKEGVLPGGLGVVRRASALIRDVNLKETEQSHEDRIVAAYAFAVGEQNASNGKIVTAPTCGSSGVLPAVFRFAAEQKNYDETTILHGLMTAGLLGILVKTNASVSGAECGCQAEIGTACSMAAAGLAEMYGMSLDEIEYSAEVALEHHLGLTCDPVGGLVQIPCIERNAVAAMRAINAVSLASFLTDSRKISFDTVVRTMYETGLDMCVDYRETSTGGLAKNYKRIDKSNL